MMDMSATSQLVPSMTLQFHIRTALEETVGYARNIKIDQMKIMRAFQCAQAGSDADINVRPMMYESRQRADMMIGDAITKQNLE